MCVCVYDVAISLASSTVWSIPEIVPTYRVVDVGGAVCACGCVCLVCVCMCVRTYVGVCARQLA